MLLKEERGAKHLLPLFAAIVIAGLILASTLIVGRESASQSSSSTRNVTEEARSLVSQLVTNFSARNLNGVMAFYSDTATVSWTGQYHVAPQVFVGNGSRPSGTNTTIPVLFGNFMNHTSEMEVAPTNESVSLPTGNSFVVTSIFMIMGQGVCGQFNMTSNVSQQWTNDSGRWRIQTDIWNFTKISTQYSVIPGACF